MDRINTILNNINSFLSEYSKNCENTNPDRIEPLSSDDMKELLEIYAIKQKLQNLKKN